MIGDYLSAYQEAGLDTYEFMLLVHVYEKNPEWMLLLYNENYLLYDQSIRSLEVNGYAKRYGPDPHDITLRQSGVDFFAKHFGKTKKVVKSGLFVHTWIDDWREIFPKGSNQSGYRYRGNRLDALKKMTKFVDQYDFTKEEIFKATKIYVDKFALKGYMYMQQAHYFIDKKDSGSSLASECEGVRENIDQPIIERSDYGERLI